MNEYIRLSPVGKLRRLLRTRITDSGNIFGILWQAGLEKVLVGTSECEAPKDSHTSMPTVQMQNLKPRRGGNWLALRHMPLLATEYTRPPASQPSAKGLVSVMAL